MLAGYAASAVSGFFGLARFIALPVEVPSVQEAAAQVTAPSIGLGSSSVDEAVLFYALLRQKYYDWV